MERTLSRDGKTWLVRLPTSVADEEEAEKIMTRLVRLPQPDPRRILGTTEMGRAPADVGPLIVWATNEPEVEWCFVDPDRDALTWMCERLAIAAPRGAKILFAYDVSAQHHRIEPHVPTALDTGWEQGDFRSTPDSCRTGLTAPKDGMIGLPESVHDSWPCDIVASMPRIRGQV